jgi:hypothetical protein
LRVSSPKHTRSITTAQPRIKAASWVGPTITYQLHVLRGHKVSDVKPVPGNYSRRGRRRRCR